MPINTLRELHQSSDFHGLPPEEQMRAFEMVAAKDADYQGLPPVEQTRARRMILGGLPKAIENRQFGQAVAPELYTGMGDITDLQETPIVRSATKMAGQINQGLRAGVEAIPREPGVLWRSVPRMVAEAASGRDPFTSSPEGMEFAEQGQALGGGGMAVIRSATAPGEMLGRAGAAHAIEQAKAAGVNVSENTELAIEDSAGMAGALGQIGAMGAVGPVARALGMETPRELPPGQAWAESGARMPRNYVPARTFEIQPGETQGGLVRRQPPAIEQVAAAGEPGYQPPAPRPELGTAPIEQNPAQQALEAQVRGQAPVPVEGGARAQVVPPQPKSPEQLAEDAFEAGRRQQIADHQVELDLRIRQLEKGIKTAPESTGPILRSEAAGAPPVAGRGERPPAMPELLAAPAAPQRAPVQPAASAQERANQLLEGFGEVPPELQAEISRLGPAPAGKEYVYRFEGKTQKAGGEWFTTDPGEAASYANTPEARGRGRIRIETVDSAALDDINRGLGREPSLRGEFQLKPGFLENLRAGREKSRETLSKLVGDPTELPPELGARAQAAVDELTRMRDAGEIEFNAGVPLKGRQLKAAAEVSAAVLWRLAKNGLTEGARLYVPFTRRLAAEFPELKPYSKQLYDEAKKHFAFLESKTPGGVITSGEYEELYQIGQMMGGDKWYTRNMPALKAEAERIYGPERAQQLVRMAAAISARTTTGIAAREAIQTMDALAAGKKIRELPDLSGIAKKSREAKRAELLNEGTVTGAKLADFDRNLMAAHEGSPPPESVADTLKFKIMGFPAGENKAPPKAARRFTKTVDEQLAREKGVAPGEVQAATWVSARHFGLGKIPLDSAPSELSFAEELFDHLERSGKMPEGRFNYADIAKRTVTNGGSTTHPKYGDLAGTDAYSVSIFPDQTHIQMKAPTAADILKYRVAKNGLIRSDPQISIGTWHDTETGKYYLDLVVTPKSREEAVHLAEQYGQKAIFDLKNMKEINTFSEREIPASELPPPKERMAQFRAAEQADERIKLRHFSPEPIEEISTEHFGEGALSNSEIRRGAEPSIHGYLGDVPPEKLVLDRAKYEVGYDLPKGAKLYDIGKDPDGLVAKHGGDLTAVEGELKDRGMGLFNSGFDSPTLSGIVKWFGSRPAIWRKEIDDASRRAYLDLIKAHGARPKGTVIGSLGGGAQDFVEDLPHLAKIGALKIARGAVDLATFTAEMSKEFPQYKDQMEDLFKASQQAFVKIVTVGGRTASENPKIEKYAASVNQTRMSASTEPEIAARIAQLGEVIQKRGPIKRSEIEEAAYKLGFSLEDAEKFANQTTEQRAKFLATRDVLDDYSRQWKEAKDAYLESGTREASNKFSDATAMQIRAFRASSAVAGEAGRALSSYNITTQPLVSTKAMKAVNQLLDQLEKKHGPLWQEAIDRLAMVDFEDPASVQAFVNYAHPYTTRFRDWMYEAWISSILSGPATHMANIIGNEAFLALRPVERAATAGVEAVRAAVSKTPREHFFGEVPADVVGVIGGIGDATRAFVKAVHTGVSTENIGKLEHAPAIPGRTGQVIRAPLTLLGAADDFFKILARRGERYANAYKTAAKDGLTGKALAEETTRLVKNPTEAMLIRENEEALYRTFQTRVGKFGRAAYSLREASEPTKYIAPFIRTPINIAKAGLERTGPLNLIRIAKMMKEGTLTRENFSPEMAKAVLGTAVAASVVPLVLSGQVTGGGPPDPERRKAWMAGGAHQPYSIKVGDTWYSYRRIEPFSTMIGTVADFVELGEKNITDKKAGEVAMKLAKAITVNLTSKTWLEGLNNFFDAMDDPGRYGEKFAGRLVSGVVPNVVAQYERAGDVRRDVRSVRDFITERIPGLREKLPTVRDIRGRTLPVPEGSRAERFVSPLPRMKDKSDPIDRILFEVSADIAPLSRRLTVRGETIELDPKQYEELVKLSGDLTDEYLRGVYPTLEGLPKALQLQQVRGAVRKARNLARTSYLYELHPDDMLLPAIERSISAFDEPGLPTPPLSEDTEE